MSLVDLSSGGALLELAFPLPPESRFAVELHTAAEQVKVPFQLLRCYVAELSGGGITYRAAGAFDSLLNLPALAARASTRLQRLLGALEHLLRTGQKSAVDRAAGAFNEILAEVLIGLRRGESIDLATLKVKARLTQTYRSLSIARTVSPARDALMSVECFGLTFRSTSVLSTNDRRFLKANAQLLSMLEACRDGMREDGDDELSSSSQIIHSAAEWQLARSAPAMLR